MTDILTADIDSRVHEVLTSGEGTYHQRAERAATLIEEHVRGEHHISGRLPVPIEWQHRVPSSVDTEPRTIAYKPFDHNEVAVHVDEPLPGDPILKTAFHAEYDGNDDLAEAAFEAFWQQDRS